MSVNYVFKSNLSGYITAYLDMMSAAGYKYEGQKRKLRHFDQYCYDHHAPADCLPRHIVEGFCFGDEYEAVSMKRYRITLLCQLAAYMQRAGCPVYFVPLPPLPFRCPRHRSYIYTEQQLKELFSCIDTWKQADKDYGNRKAVDPLLFRMLYGCGLRLGEALNLKASDVDLAEGVLKINMAKNNKDRFVPMASSLTGRCKKYIRETQIENGPEGYFFPGRGGGRYDNSTIYIRFRQYLWKAGISHQGKGPRIHDLRHTYCVHRLKKWTLESKELSNLIPYLSAYLGHADFRGTEYYLRLTADLYPDMVSRMEVYCHGVIPQKGGSHE